MAHVPFRYDDELLSSCATSSYAASATKELFGGGENYEQVDPSCYKLFQQFASHYSREADTTDADPPINHNRLRRFVDNAVFVYRHNNDLLDDDENAEQSRHRVALNQFSDRLEHELPLMDEGVADDFIPDFDSLPLWGTENEFGRSQSSEDATAPIFSRLESEHFMQAAASAPSIPVFGFLMRKYSTNTRAFRSHFSSGRRRFEDEVPPLPGSASSSSPVFIWSKKGQSSIYLERETDRKRYSVRKDKMDGSDATPYAPPPDGKGVDGFSKSLDWSTTNNPDGVPIIHPVIDQGSWYVAPCASSSSFPSEPLSISPRS